MPSQPYTRISCVCNEERGYRETAAIEHPHQVERAVLSFLITTAAGASSVSLEDN